MQKELISFIEEHELSPFHASKTPVSISGETIFKTKDAKAIHQKVLSTLASHFYFSDTKNLFSFFAFTSTISEIQRRQEFFHSALSIASPRPFLSELETPKSSWRPPYDIIVVTEDENTFTQLKDLDIPVKFINTQYDVQELESYDLVQCLDCDQFQMLLEQLPQSVFLSSIDEAYLERYVELLSGWKNILQTLQSHSLPELVDNLVKNIMPLISLLQASTEISLTRDQLDNSLETMNEVVTKELEKLTITGTSLIELLSKQKLPIEFEKIVEQVITSSGLPEHLFSTTIPVSLDAAEVEKFLKQQSTNQYLGVAERIKKHALALQGLPQQLHELECQLLLLDFLSGISEFLFSENFNFPKLSDRFVLSQMKNIFLENPQEISFSLDPSARCSILTGANSGGKTTLLEHILQIISLFQLGLPTFGSVELPLFSEVYYFAKNKGSLNKGAFETLLTQMATITPGKQTLILADEIESVTEPGVAGVIVCATAEYFLQRGCFLVIATHLGKDIQQRLPLYARIDGIEAKGLNDKYELIVDHNPVLGRLAHSTPELIVERMANAHKDEYFIHLHEFLKKGQL